MNPVILRIGLSLLLLTVASLAGGCAWWEKNIAKPVKGAWDKTIAEPVQGITKRRLTITTDPPGADVFVNDVFQGKTPLTLNYKMAVRDLFKGLTILVEKEGYLPVRRDITTDSQTVIFRLIRRKRTRR